MLVYPQAGAPSVKWYVVDRYATGRLAKLRESGRSLASGPPGVAGLAGEFM